MTDKEITKKQALINLQKIVKDADVKATLAVEAHKSMKHAASEIEDAVFAAEDAGVSAVVDAVREVYDATGHAIKVAHKFAYIAASSAHNATDAYNKLLKTSETEYNIESEQKAEMLKKEKGGSIKEK